MAKVVKRSEVAVVEHAPVANVDVLQMDDDEIALMQEYEGAGLSSKSEDNLVPIITLLQDLSPQAKARDPEYVEGAVPGSIFIKSTNLLISGEEGFLFQPCSFRTAVVEWVPRDSGGGLVASYETMPTDAVSYINEKGKSLWKSAAGNDLVETRYHSGYLEYGDIRMPAVLSFSSTGHSVSKGWMTQMNNVTVPTPNGPKKAPSWFKKYKITSRLKQKNNQEWFIFDVVPYEWVQDKNQREDGRALFEAFEEGTKTIDHETEPSELDKDVPF